MFHTYCGLYVAFKCICLMSVHMILSLLGKQALCSFRRAFKKALLIFTFTFMHLADAFIQSDLQCIQFIKKCCQYVCIYIYIYIHTSFLFSSSFRTNRTPLNYEPSPSTYSIYAIYTVEVKPLHTTCRICKMLIILLSKRDHTKCMLLFI